MKVCVIGSEKKSESTMKIFNALKESNRFDSVFFAPTEKIRIGVKNGDFPIFYRDADLTTFDAVMPRIGSSKALFGYLITKYLRKANVYVPFTPEAVFISHDKYLTLSKLNEAKIPVPETYLTMSPPTAKRIIKEMKFPVVMKLLGGSGGKGVMFTDKENTAISLIDTLNVLKQPLFIEKYIKNPGEDIRIIVIGDEVVAAMKRISTNGDLRANLSSGGKGVIYKPDAEMKEIAIKAAKTIGAEICGVDFIQGKKGPAVIEVNICPGMKISDITGFNVQKRIAEFIAERTEEYKSIYGSRGLSEYIERELLKVSKWLKEAFE